MTSHVARPESAPFLFTREHLAFEESVASLARKEFRGGYLERASSEEMCWPQLAMLGEVGLLGLSIPEEAGGQGADPITVGIGCEQMAKADFNLSYFVFSSVLALAVTEPCGGSDTAGMAVTARPVPGGYRLSGEKTSVTLAMHAEHAIVVARNDQTDGPRTRRFLVPLDQQNISRERFRDPGFRPLGRGSLTFDGTFVPADHELTSSGSGLSAQLSDFDYSRTLIGLMCIGAARRAIDATIDWVRDRDAFGGPIARFQGVSFTLAEHDTQLEAARWLCYRALALRAAGLPHTREAAMCKWWIPQLAVRAINDCIVLHGHMGWSNEMPLQQLLLDVSGLQIGDGTPQIQKLVIARHLIGRDYTG